jgi:iron complex transport system substrate-binding protein
MDGDHIFLMSYGNSQSKLQELQNQPQWKQLTAVKNGKAHLVSDDVWSLGIGIGAANKVIDDLYMYVANTK